MAELVSEVLRALLIPLKQPWVFCLCFCWERGGGGGKIIRKADSLLNCMRITALALAVGFSAVLLEILA